MPARDAEPSFLEPILGIVFDLDGTLVLSHHDMGRIRGEVIKMAERHGVPPGRLTVRDPMHRIIENAREQMRLGGLPDAAYWRFETDYRKAIDAIELEALPRTVPRGGSTDLLEALTRRGFRLAILTRSSEAFARAALQKTGLGKFFPYLRTRSAKGPAKPDPEALLLLLKEMGVPLDRALFVGDHLIDAECATRARVRFYAVLPDPTEGPTEMTVDRFLAGGAAAVARDLGDLQRQLATATPPHA